MSNLSLRQNHNWRFPNHLPMNMPPSQLHSKQTRLRMWDLCRTNWRNRMGKCWIHHLIFLHLERYDRENTNCFRLSLMSKVDLSHQSHPEHRKSLQVKHLTKTKMFCVSPKFIVLRYKLYADKFHAHLNLRQQNGHIMLFLLLKALPIWRFTKFTVKSYMIVSTLFYTTPHISSAHKTTNFNVRDNHI